MTNAPHAGWRIVAASAAAARESNDTPTVPWLGTLERSAAESMTTKAKPKKKKVFHLVALVGVSGSTGQANIR